MSTPAQDKEAEELALFVKAMRANCFFASIDPVEGKLQYGRDQDRFTGWKLAREAAAVEPSPALVQPEAELVARRFRYRSEPGMIGHYPWSYTERPGHLPSEVEVESLYAGAAPVAQAEQDAMDAKRWRMLPAFTEDHQIDYMRLLREIDAAMKGTA